jgi:hypothetical protein
MMAEFSKNLDTSQPSAGRVYDFLLGGDHNFEADRQAAQAVLQVAPFMPLVLKQIRSFLGVAAKRLVADGFINFIDFASGLPTNDNIHHFVGSGSKVVYSDIDDGTIEYGREILENIPDVYYVKCDARKPEELLTSELVEKLFHDDRKVAIGFSGIAYFLPDEDLGHALQILYSWVNKGSKLFLCDADADSSEITSKLKPVFELYSKMGQPLHIRTKEKLEKIALPWEIEQPGFQTLDKWIGEEENITELQRSEWGGKGFYGAIFYK